MGQAIGGRLMGLGHALHVWNRTETHAQALRAAEPIEELRQKLDE